MNNKLDRDWNNAFENSAYIRESKSLPDQWTRAAAQYRKKTKIDIDISYGNQDREVMDIVWPDGKVKGLAVFVHGGYWMQTDKSYWTDLAEGARAQGWAVCLPSYTLAPNAPIKMITLQIGAAISKAAKIIEGPIRLAGHSAGGHLVSRMICDDSPLKDTVLKRIQHTLSISGIHDLRPLLHTKMNNILRLGALDAKSESAVLHMPKKNACVTCWVGGGERPEFIRQAQLLTQMWDGLGADISYIQDKNHDHFSVIQGLKDKDSPITTAFINSI
ncbi:MAG: alpha/beta hydrolase [Rhizobiales bacterium]|nr:alpha/beta hydrolase [Hyphomicrobiales bacterium]